MLNSTSHLCCETLMFFQAYLHLQNDYGKYLNLFSKSYNSSFCLFHFVVSASKVHTQHHLRGTFEVDVFYIFLVAITIYTVVNTRYKSRSVSGKPWSMQAPEKHVGINSGRNSVEILHILSLFISSVAKNIPLLHH